MRIAFCGKGGSGKSTLSSLFARYLAAENQPVLVMDGDINQHLGKALGFADAQISAQKRLGVDYGVLHDYLKGDNPRIASADLITENTPPGSGSGLIYFEDRNNIVSQTYEIEGDGIRFIALGGHSDEQIGATCYHAFTHKMGSYMNHLIDGDGQYFVADMCAGADPFATAQASKFDAIALVVEPTEKSVGVYDQCVDYAKPYGIDIFVIGNKIEDEDDLDFIREKVGDSLIGHIARSDFVRKQEKGQFQPISALEAENTELLAKIKKRVDMLTRDWAKYQKNNLHFLETAAKSWADDLYKTNIMDQVDPDFRYEDLLTHKQKAA